MSWLSKEIGWLKSKVIYEWLPGKAKRKKRFFAEFIEQGDLCYDIGAHLGDRTDTFISLGASVVAIEPQPRFYNYLKNKFRAQSNTEVLPIAIGAKAGKATFHISNDHPTLSTLSDKEWRRDMDGVATYEVRYDEKIEVVVSTMDQLISIHGSPRFIKIDVEGFELSVLQGLSNGPEYISIEFLSFDLKRLKECLMRLKEMGYQKFNWSYKETFKWVQDDWGQKGDLLNSIANYEDGIFSGDVYAWKSKSAL